jgi:hypothetical protein
MTYDVLIRYSGRLALGDDNRRVVGVVVRLAAVDADSALRMAVHDKATFKPRPEGSDQGRLSFTIVPADAPFDGAGLTRDTLASAPLGGTRDIDWPIVARAAGVTDGALLSLARRVCADAGVPTPATVGEVREIRAGTLAARLHALIEQQGA